MIKIIELKVFDIYNDIDLKDYISKKEYFCEFIQMDLKINNSEKYIYTFEFNLCDLKGLENLILTDVPDYRDMNISELKGYNILVIKEYNYEVLLDYLNVIFNKALKQSNDSVTIAKIINRYLGWRDYSY